MKQKLEKAKIFVKEHKKEIVIGAGVAIIGGVIFVIARKKPKIIDTIQETVKVPYERVKLDIPESLAAKGVTDFSGPGEWLDLWLNDTPISELGALGEELVKHYDFLDPKDTIGGVVTVGGLNLVEKKCF